MRGFCLALCGSAALAALLGVGLAPAVAQSADLAKSELVGKIEGPTLVLATFLMGILGLSWRTALVVIAGA